MSDPTVEQLLQSIESESDAPAITAESLAERMPAFPASAIEEALRMLSLSGVLTKETLPDGRVGYRYAHPERYRMIGTSDVKQPGPDFGRR